MAGEIYIADKATLDEVNNKSDIIKDSIDRNDYITLDQYLNKLKVLYSSESLNGNVTKTHLDINTPGVLYYILGTATNPCHIKITLDNKIIFWRPLHGLYRSGIVYPQILLTASEGTTISTTTNTVLNTNRYALSSEQYALIGGHIIVPPEISTTSSTSCGISILPKPLKFNKLKVEYLVGSNDTATTFDCSYLLD